MPPRRSIRFAVLPLLLLLLAAAAGAVHAFYCPAGLTACGASLLHTVPASRKNGRCIDGAGDPVLCSPMSQACGPVICDHRAFCGTGTVGVALGHSGCQPETCAHRLASWCPKAGTQLTRVACPSDAAASECYTSSSSAGEFSCAVSALSGLLVANCSGQLAVGVAAAASRPAAGGAGRSWLQAAWHRLVRTAEPSPAKLPARRRSRRSLLQLFLPGLDSSTLNHVFPGGDSYDSGPDDFSSLGPIQQQQQLGSGATPGGLSFTPVVNPAGNVIQTGSNPGGAFIAASPGGLIAGSYGGGWQGPYNAATGTYGVGGSYGFPRAYQGYASGSAVVFMPAAFAPNSPNITYPCPLGRPVGSMLTVGIPCGIPITSVPAAWLPTNGGLPAGVDLTKLPGVGSATPVGGNPATTPPVVPRGTPVAPPPVTAPPNPTPMPIPVPPPTASPPITPPIVRPVPLRCCRACQAACLAFQEKLSAALGPGLWPFCNRGNLLRLLDRALLPRPQPQDQLLPRAQAQHRPQHPHPHPPLRLQRRGRFAVVVPTASSGQATQQNMAAAATAHATPAAVTAVTAVTA